MPIDESLSKVDSKLIIWEVLVIFCPRSGVNRQKSDLNLFFITCGKCDLLLVDTRLLAQKGRFAKLLLVTQFHIICCEDGTVWYVK